MNSVVTMAERELVSPANASSAAQESCLVTPLTSDGSREWERYVLAHEAGSLFHTLAWRDAVYKTFGHESVYLIARRAGRMVGVLPLFFMNSRIVGKLLVSVPYGVGGGILADDRDTTIALFASARELALQRSCGVIDLRSEQAVVPDLPVVDHYFGFRRALPNHVDDVLPWLPRKARAAARNARNKFNLTTSYGDEHLVDVWRLYAHNMRRLASPNYPLSFMKHLIERTPQRHWVSVVKWKDRPVAGLVTFLFKDSVMPYFFGAAPAAQRCSAANHIYLAAMERGVAEGYHIFDFGRSRRSNVGSCNFKRFQGFEPYPLGYQQYTAPGCTPPKLSPDDARYRLARSLWTRLPLCVARPLGARITRHLPG